MVRGEKNRIKRCFNAIIAISSVRDATGEREGRRNLRYGKLVAGSLKYRGPKVKRGREKASQMISFYTFQGKGTFMRGIITGKSEGGSVNSTIFAREVRGRI